MTGIEQQAGAYFRSAQNAQPGRSGNKAMTPIIHNGIEFVLPGIQKGYPRCWAEDFLTRGIVYFTNLIVIKQDEHPQRGDRFEGSGHYVRDGKSVFSDYANPIFVWCATMEMDPAVVRATWRDRDTVLQITNTLALAERIQNSLQQQADVAECLVGPVTYDRDIGSHRHHDWADGIFQKGGRYGNQKEFRFAVIGHMEIKTQDHIILELGACSDIARIAE